LFHPDFVRSVSDKYALRDWPNSFYTGFFQKEFREKPWCHFTLKERADWNVGDRSQFGETLEKLTGTVFKTYNVE